MSKYDLVVHNRIVKTIITTEINREVVLVDMIRKANGRPFKIILTENKIKSLLLASGKHKQFIKYLYETSR